MSYTIRLEYASHSFSWAHMNLFSSLPFTLFLGVNLTHCNIRYASFIIIRVLWTDTKISLEVNYFYKIAESPSLSSFLTEFFCAWSWKGRWARSRLKINRIVNFWQLNCENAVCLLKFIHEYNMWATINVLRIWW